MTAALFNPISLVEAFGPILPSALPLVDRTKEGNLKPTQQVTMNNVVAGLASLGVLPTFNMMNATVRLWLPERIDMARFGKMTDADRDRMCIEAACDAFARVGLRSRREVRSLIVEAALNNRWHPMEALATSKRWDGVDHYGKLLASVKTPDPDLFAMYLHRWLIQVIECACGWQERPESEKALCLVLSGPQGIGKSRWVTSLVPSGWARGGISLALGGTGSRDSKHEALKQLISELSEVGSTTKKNLVEELKAFLAAESDSYRLPYSISWLDRPRCTSFAATTNEDEFLVDATGNRRFLTVKVERCEPKHGIDLQQLWAQVHSWWAAGEPWYLTPAEEKIQAARNLDHTQVDGMEDILGAEIDMRRDNDAYPHAAGLNVSHILRITAQEYLHPLTRGKATRALNKLLGKHRKLTKWGGVDRAWPWWCSSAELRSHHLTEMTPGWQTDGTPGAAPGAPPKATNGAKFAPIRTPSPSDGANAKKARRPS